MAGIRYLAHRYFYGFILLLVSGTASAQIRLELTPELSGDLLPSLSIGALTEATDGIDALDLPEPPPPPGQPVTAAFVAAGYVGPLPNLWRRDFRDLETFVAQGILLWDLRLDTGDQAQAVTLHVDLVEGQLDDFELVWLHGGSDTEVIPIPGSVTIQPDEPQSNVYLAIVEDDDIGVETRSWSWLRARFR